MMITLDVADSDTRAARSGLDNPGVELGDNSALKIHRTRWVASKCSQYRRAALESSPVRQNGAASVPPKWRIQGEEVGKTHPEITVHAQTPRHRRTAGSGPPASALIAWLSTDPYLRDATTTASHRREIAVPLLSETRSAKAATAVCFVLACAALVGITEIVSHGRAAAQDTIATAHPGDAGRPEVHRHQLMGTNNTFNGGGDNSPSR